MCSLSHSNSLTRVRSLQRELDKLGLDAILCIPGVDSNYNDGCRRLYSYLLCDLSGDELDQLELGPSLEEEDTFLLITPVHISVYCHPDCYHSIVARLGRWHSSISLFCDLSHPDREDTDHFEVYKVTSFIQMTEGVNKIGVPFGKGSILTTKEEHDFSPMSVEQWPLIQAYALEEMGGLGFFTMTHKLCDVTHSVEQLYSEVDPLSVGYLQKRGAKLFCKQWEDMIDSVSRLEPDDIMKLSEQTLLSGMRTYLQHSKLSRQSLNRAKGYAYVLIGQNSQKLKYKPCPVASNLATVATSEGVSQHCVVELGDPLLPLTAARTFFFAQNHYLCNLSPDSQARPGNSDHGYLLLLYKDLVDEIRSVIHSMSGVVSLENLKESVTRRLRSAVCRGREGGEIGIEVQVSCYNLRKVEVFDTANFHKHVYYLKSTLTDIQSPTNPARKLGAIVFGETFVISPLRVQEATECRSLILSEPIPVLVTWADRESQLLGGHSLKICLQSTDQTELGNPISLGTSDVMLSTDFIHGMLLPVKLHVLSEGLILQNSVWKFLWLPWRVINRIKLVEVGREEKQLQIYPKVEYRCNLPLFLHTESFSLLYPPSGTEHNRLRREIVGFLKSLRSGGLFSCQDLDSTASTDSRYTVLQDFNQHLEISYLYDGCISLQAISSLSPPDTTAAGNVLVHVLAGLPGSNVDALATSIRERTRGDAEWVVMSPPLQELPLFNKLGFQTSFLRVVEECLEKKDGTIVLISPCFTTPTQVVEALLSHPSPVVCDNVRISTVTLCIGLNSSFTENDRLHPLVIRSIRPGVVTSILITGCSPSSQTSTSSHLSRLLHLCRSIATGAGVMQTLHISNLSTEDLSCVLSDQLFRKLAPVRSWYNPILYKSSTLTADFSIGCRSIECTHHLSREFLASALNQLPDNVQYVRGVVNFDADTPLYHHLEMAHSHIQFYPITTCQDKTSVVSFYGNKLECVDFVSVIQSSLPADKQKLCAKSEDNLSQEELGEIEAICKDTPLPEGVFFNGHLYVGFEGDKWSTHPCRQDIISRFLADLNRKIESQNMEIDRFYQDIFPK